MPMPTPAATMRQRDSREAAGPGCASSRPAEAGGVVHHEGVDGAAGVQADEGFAEHVGEGRRAWPASAMAGGDDEHQPVLPVPVSLTARPALGGDDADIHLPRRHRLDDRRARLFLN